MTFADLFECTIDFEGQRLAENLIYYVLIVASLVGFIIGYSLESIQLTLALFGIGLITACFLVLPPWPMYRRHSISWVKHDTPEKTDSLNTQD
ncbi:microsomal signal peptidase 12 kDa subunit-domain-containing protein [Chlamydoabsidia padenii]|nr:microsomal signal peptidase 12 kDa subunit-domain-containing protein [Chlamydoabsidia padenii]